MLHAQHDLWHHAGAVFHSWHCVDRFDQWYGMQALKDMDEKQLREVLGTTELPSWIQVGPSVAIQVMPLQMCMESFRKCPACVALLDPAKLKGRSSSSLQCE